MNATNRLLQIHNHPVDGSSGTFDQSDEHAAKRILDEIQLSRIFNQDRMIIADRCLLAFLPGPELVPMDAWPARQAEVAQPERADSNFHGSLDERLPHASFPQDGQMNFEPARRRQNESKPAMERKHQ